MKKIKIFIFIILFFWFYSALASNVPVGYWGNTFTKNNKINNTNYDIPLGYIGNNFNKKLTYTGYLNQTPIGFFANYKGKIIKIPKLNKIIYDKVFNDLNKGANIKKTKTLDIKLKNDILKKRIELSKINGEIYIYRLREYMKNNDGSFTNIDTLKPYTGNIENLKKKVIKKDILVKEKVIKKIPIKDTTSKEVIIKKEVINKKIDTPKPNIANNSIIDNTANKINTDINLQEKIRQEIIRNNEIQAEKKRVFEQNKQYKLNNLKSRIELAKSNGRIYTYRLREYIKNNDGSFSNIDTYRSYTGKTSNLKIKTEENKQVVKTKKSKIKSNKKTKSKKKKTTKKTKTKSKINIKNKTIFNKKGNFILDSKALLYDMIYIFSVKQRLIKIKNNNFNNYILLKSCFIGDKCNDIDYYDKIKEDINNSINIIYLSKRLNINIKNMKILNYKDMLEIIFKVFGKEKYFNLNISKSQYSNNIDKLLGNIIKGEKLSSNKVDFKSYKRIYFSLLESPDFINKLEKILFNN